MVSLLKLANITEVRKDVLRALQFGKDYQIIIINNNYSNNPSHNNYNYKSQKSRGYPSVEPRLFSRLLCIIREGMPIIQLYLHFIIVFFLSLL